MVQPDMRPRTVPEAVQAVLDRDGVVSEAMVRGIVNHRALARWIIDIDGLKASEDAVLSAIRRARRDASGDPYDEAYGILARSHLNVRSGVCQVIAPRSPAVQEKLGEIFRLVDFERGEVLYYTHGDNGVKIVVDEANRADVESLLGRDVREVVKDLAALCVVQPPEAMWVSGILALLTQALALKQINVVDAVWGYPEYIFYVRQEDTLSGYQALDGLIGAARHRTSGAGKSGKKR